MGRLVRVALVAAGCALGFGVVIPGQAYAHGFGERYDLPVPLWLYVGGAGATVALSFVVIGLFVRGTPRLNDYPRLNPNPPMDGARTGEGGKGVTGAMIRARIG